MVEGTPIYHPKVLRAIDALARYYARQAAKEQIRARNQRVTDYDPRDISVMARALHGRARASSVVREVEAKIAAQAARNAQPLVSAPQHEIGFPSWLFRNARNAELRNLYPRKGPMPLSCQTDSYIIPAQCQPSFITMPLYDCSISSECSWVCPLDCRKKSRRVFRASGWNGSTQATSMARQRWRRLGFCKRKYLRTNCPSRAGSWAPQARQFNSRSRLSGPASTLIKW